MVDTEMGSDPFLMILQMGGQDLPGSQFHVMSHGPGGVHPVDDDSIKCWAHVLRDRDGHVCCLADLEGGFHEAGSLALPGRGWVPVGL